MLFAVLIVSEIHVSSLKIENIKDSEPFYCTHLKKKNSINIFEKSFTKKSMYKILIKRYSDFFSVQTPVRGY